MTILVIDSRSIERVQKYCKEIKLAMSRFMCVFCLMYQAYCTKQRRIFRQYNYTITRKAAGPSVIFNFCKGLDLGLFYCIHVYRGS